MAPSSYYLVTTFLYLTTVFHFVEPKLPGCTFDNFSGNKFYTFCNDLPTSHSFLHWTYDGVQSTISIAFVARPARPDGWVAWAINPTGSGMIGSQALVAFRDADGEMTVKTYNISFHGPLTESKVWFEVKELSAEFLRGEIKIFATLLLPQKGLKSVNYAWQVGGSVTDGVPDKHGLKPDNLNSKGVLDLFRGDANGEDKVDLIIREGHINGVLHVVCWGFFLPVGIIIARYRKDFLAHHGLFQLTAYIFGSALFATSGILLYVIIFILATLQVLSPCFTRDHNSKNWFYWKIFHHGCGYTILVLTIINVFKAFDKEKPKYSMFRIAYFVLITIWVVVVVFLEVTNRRKESSASITPYNGSDIRQDQFEAESLTQ